jgi:hypothetical protein
MIYVLIPHAAQHWDHMRIFVTYALMEQVALRTAFALVREGKDENWCTVTAYEGTDEAHPHFLYWVQNGRLQREPVPSPSP